MRNFPKPTDSVGGIQKYWFVPVNDVAALGDIILNELQSITFETDKDWLTGYGVYDSKTFTEDKKENKTGIRFLRSLKIFYPGFDLAAVNQMAEMHLTQFIIAYKDFNGNYKVAGTLDNPLNFKYKLATGKNGGNSQGYDMEFFGDSRVRIMELNIEDTPLPFETVTIGEQMWSAYNLDIDDEGVGILYPNNDIFNVPDYGLLYTLAAAERIADSIQGWRLPTNAECSDLNIFLSPSPGYKMRDLGTSFWTAPNSGATNSSGFNGRGAGVHAGSYILFKDRMYIWTSDINGSFQIVRDLRYNNDQFTQNTVWNVNDAISLRLIKE